MPSVRRRHNLSRSSPGAAWMMLHRIRLEVQASLGLASTMIVSSTVVSIKRQDEVT